MANKTGNKENLKWLQSQIKRLTKGISDLIYQRDMINQEIFKRQNSLNKLETSLINLTKTPQISEHAILRYLERVLKLNIEGLKKEIMTTEVIDQIKEIGSGELKINISKEGIFVFCLKGNIITTIRKEN